LVAERRERAAIHSLLFRTPVLIKGNMQPPTLYSELLREQLDKMIPMIPFLPKDNPKYDEELRLVKQLTTGF
jgi:hypothetical protein